MSILDMITGNKGLVPLAAGKLKGLFQEKGLTAIVVQENESNQESMLPGFDISQYDVPIVIVNKTKFEERQRLDASHPFRLTKEEFEEYEALKGTRHEADLFNTQSENNG